MTALLTRILAAVHLAPAGDVVRARLATERAAKHAAALEARVKELQSDIETWKTRHQQSSAAASEWKQAAKRSEDELKKAAEHLARVRAQSDEWKTRSEALSGQVRDLRERLDESRRVASLAREHLMATEVKLDLVEAAIQILDVRTRERSLTKQ